MMTPATPRRLASAIVAAAAVVALLPIGGPLTWGQVRLRPGSNNYFEIDADDGSTFWVNPDGDRPPDGYLEDAGVRCEWAHDGNGQPWVHIPQDAYMGQRAYMVDAHQSNPTARTEVVLMDGWNYLNAAHPKTLYFSFAFFVRVAPQPSVPNCIILQVHQASGRPPPVMCQIVRGGIRFSAWGQTLEYDYTVGDYKRHWTLLLDPYRLPPDELGWEGGTNPERHARMKLVTHRWYRFLLEVTPSIYGSGRGRLWWMDEATGLWELVGDKSDIPIGWITKMPGQDRHPWEPYLHYKTGIYGAENFAGRALVHLDNVSFSNRWTLITKNRTVGYHRAVVALPFDEAAGNTAFDRSHHWNDGWGYENDGVLHGPPLRTFGGVRGAADRCLYFDGEGTDYVRVPLNNDVEFDTGNYLTLSAWIKTNHSQRDAGLVTIGEFSDSYKARLYYSDDRTVDFSVRHPSVSAQHPFGHRVHVVAENLPRLNDGRWHHLTGTYNRFAPDRQRLKLYLDGRLAAAAEGQDLPIARGRDDSSMYAAKMSGQYFAGYMDEVVVFNYAMTPADVRWHHACYLSRDCWFIREAPNIRPVANAGEDRVLDLRQAVTVKLDASGSRDPDGDALRYRWRQTAGPPVRLQRARSQNAVAQVEVPDEETVLEFRLTVDDRQKTSDPDTVRVRLRPAVRRPLQACFSTSPSPRRGAPIDFDARCTQARVPRAAVTSWRWDFGDGAATSSQRAIHTYAVAGTYTVTLAVTDDRGNTHVLRRPVAVAPGLPFRDDFDAAPGPVSGWTPWQGGWIVTDSQELAPTTEGAEAWVWAGSPPAVMSGDATVAFELRPDPGGPKGREGGRAGVVMFAADPTNGRQTSGYTVSWSDREEDRGVAITRFDRGVPTRLNPATPGPAEAPSRLRIQVSGPSIAVYGDGVPLAEARDDTYRDGHLGLWAHRGGREIRFDEFCAGPGRDPCAVPLTACFATSQSPASATTVVFDGRCSAFVSRDSELASWQWEFGDGSTGSGEVATHTYPSMGVYTASLTVRGRTGPPATREQLVRVPHQHDRQDDAGWDHGPDALPRR